jgi:hypothetical protein
MPKYHERAGIPHYNSNLLSHFRLETVNRAFGTGCLAFLERASFKTVMGISQK